MDYQNTLLYLYNSVPMFQQVGSSAYKEGLENTLALDEHFGHPHRNFHSIHVGGTNGKGSCSHTLAAILQEAGYRVGLYTSPHLVDFRERIRINGQPIPEEYVVRFVEKELIGYQIEFTEKFTGIEVNLFIPFLEFVQFFKNYDGKINIVLLEILKTVIVVKDYIRINHKIFLCSHTLLDLNC